MRIEVALTQVRAIQLQLARMEQCCCYRWITVTAGGIVAVAAALLQHVWLAHPAEHPDAFVVLWVCVAALNVAIIGAEMVVRWVRCDSEFARRQMLIAVQQFSPCLIVGALLTAAIRTARPEYASLYPALWSILFSLGIFASWRFLPSQTVFAALYYVLAGLICIRWAQGEQSLQPWTMLITFGAGQFITSFILYRSQETVHGDS
jgi:hypothetical protein